MSSLHTLITFCSDENLHICLFKLWFVNLKILWAAFCYFVLLHLVTTTSHHFNDESNYYCFFLAAFVSMVSDANLIWQLVMSKHEMGCQFLGPAFVSMIPHCAHIFSLTRCFFISFSAPLARASQRCPHWQRPPLHRALHLKPGTTTIDRNTPSILLRYIRISFALTLLFVTTRATVYWCLYCVHHTLQYKHGNRCPRIVLTGMTPPWGPFWN